jgi:L-alanine-DL-glutamate epimerase-like enolase superfamily enzyme
MKITNVRAHHIRIPYDAGVASFRQGASSIAALDIVVVEVSTDSGITGWGDAFSYVCPRSTCTAIDEMIAPQARGLEVPDAAGIPAFMEQVQRNLHLFGRYGITMFAISGLDIALWDLAAKVQGVPLHRLIGDIKRAKFRPMRACCGSASRS